MEDTKAPSAASLARNLLAKAAAPDIITEGSSFETAALGEAVGQRLEGLVPRHLPDELSGDEVLGVQKKLFTEAELTQRDEFILEAIILPDLRPALFVSDDTYRIDHPAWPDYVQGSPAHAHFRQALPSVGRIELIGHPGVPYGGTGFVVGDGLVMTNRHVAQIFASGVGVGGVRFIDGLGSAVDFQREWAEAAQREIAGTPIEVSGIAMIHPYFDLALLRVDGLGARAPLRFKPADPSSSWPLRIAVIGYPAFDPRNNVAVQEQVFGGRYNVKRLQPGLLTGRRHVRSFGHDVHAATHDSSTLGGNSGSVLIDATSGHAVGLHFAGIYKDSNFAVAAADLARDARMHDFGLAFEGNPAPERGPWDDAWANVREQVPVARVSPGGTAGTGGLKVSIPVRIEISVDEAEVRAQLSDASAAPMAEKMVEPRHDPVEVPRSGYADDFLGITVPPPVPRNPNDCARLEDDSITLDYHHFSIVMNRRRRLALFTAANVDASPAAKEPEAGRRYTRAGLGGLADGDREKWFPDPRIRGIEQLPDRFFNKDRGAFDKGHLVRREDVAWGKSFAEVQAANGDTFFVTNCSPQTAAFNRSNRRDNWGALEDLVLKQAKAERYCLFSGPVLSDDDPFFVGVDDEGAVRVRIPQAYWKVVVARRQDALEAFGFILEQDLSATDLEFHVPEQWQAHMIALADLEARLGSLDFDPVLHAADRSGR